MRNRSALYIGLVLGLICLAPAGVMAHESFKMKEPVSLDGRLIADFEGDDYGRWEATGTAFGPGPARGTLPGQMQVTGFEGQGLVNTYYQGDDSTGTLTSPLFKIECNFINFLIGGGGHPGRTCMNLLADGEIVRTATGPNIESGGTEQLEWQSWLASGLKGRMVQLQIVDQQTGTWGHINVDHIFQSDQKKQTIVFNNQRNMTFQDKYLNFPVKNGAPSRLIYLAVDGQVVRELSIELAEVEPDFWVYLDVSEFRGQTGTLTIDRFDPAWTTGFNAIFQDDTYPGQETLYREKLRPQFHFTSKRGWINDTNGMVWHDGRYHLFYQHNPYGWNWGNMTWGHAVSTDMIHWQEWGDAIHPDALGTIYSGSAVVDHDNTAGFRTGSEKPMVAFYTSAGGNNRLSQGEPFTQSMACSNDGGRTWTKYADNPVIGHIAGGTRDPKVFRHEPTNRWVMVLWIDGSTLSIFTSSDLKTWQRQSDIEGFFECPELFELPVDGDPANTRWIVYGANGDYQIGRFDGTRFIPDGGIIKFEYGNCFYASQTFNDIPAADGRRIQMGWGRGINMPEMPFNQMILFPVVLSLHTTVDGIRMFVNPVEEIESLHQQHWSWSGKTVHPGDNPLAALTGELFHIKAELKPQGADTCQFMIRDIPVVYDVSSQRLICQGKSAPLALENGKIRLEMLVDRMSIEIFANKGLVYMPIGVNLVGNSNSLGFTCEGGNVLVDTMDVHQLKSIWF